MSGSVRKKKKRRSNNLYPLKGPEDVLGALNAAEWSIYDNLMAHAKLEFTDQSRLAAFGERWMIAVGYSELSRRVNTRKEIIQDTIRRLIRKQFIEIVEKADAAKLKCTLYRVYTLEQVFQNHRDMGVKSYRKVGGGRVLVIGKKDDE